MTFPKLGFGTAPILGRLGRNESLLALERAFALGLRHFDTARSYGWGEAEEVLGGFLSRRARDSYTLVTKCGLVPQQRPHLLSAAKTIARRAVRMFPGSGALVRRAASTRAFQPTRTYDVRILAQSLETSLRHLRTSYIDLLLLHNYSADQDGVEDVVGFFQRVQREGRIKRYGFCVGGDLLSGLAHLDQRGALAGTVIQTPVTTQLLCLPPVWRSTPIIAHSPFGSAQHVAATGDRSRLQSVLRSLAGATQCEALVVSMFSMDHLEANVRDHAVEASRSAAQATPTRSP